MTARQLDFDKLPNISEADDKNFVPDDSISSVHAQMLLSTRAKMFANRDKSTVEATKEESVLIFALGSEQFAVRMTAISEVLPLGQLTSVPACDPKLIGIMPIKGEVHCIFDLTRVLELPLGPQGHQQIISGHILVLRLPGSHIGVCVDRVLAIDHIGTDLSQATTIEGGSGRKLVRPRQAPPLILIENFVDLLGTLLQGEEPT